MLDSLDPRVPQGCLLWVKKGKGESGRAFPPPDVNQSRSCITCKSLLEAKGSSTLKMVEELGLKSILMMGKRSH